MRAKLTPIVQLSDRFRKRGFSLNQISMAPSVKALPQKERRSLLWAVSNLDKALQISLHRPVAVRDCGLITLEQSEYFWQIDYLHQSSEANLDALLPFYQFRILTLLRIESETPRQGRDSTSFHSLEIGFHT